jgi:hypothetical protein
MIIFWNFAGVPFVSAIHDSFDTPRLISNSDLLLLDRVHGLTRSCDVSLLNPHLRCAVLHAPNRLLHVRPLQLHTLHHSHAPSRSFDTSMSQKSRFKMQMQGTYEPRWTFPQLPWGTIENPTYIETAHGNKLLTSGWWQFARKPVSIYWLCESWAGANLRLDPVELLGRLDPESYMGSLRRVLLANSLLLLVVLLHRLGTSVRSLILACDCES